MSNRDIACISFILRHIAGTPPKSTLTAIAALFFVIFLGFFQMAVVYFEKEVDRLYDTTIVSGEVRKADPMGFNWTTNIFMRDDILRATVDELIETGFFQSIYAEAGWPWFYIIPPDEADRFNGEIGSEYWDWFNSHLIPYYQEFYGHVDGWMVRVDPLMAFSDYNAFLKEFAGNDPVVPGAIAGNDMGALWGEDFTDAVGDAFFIPPLEVAFATGFREGDFVYTDSNLESPIPVILSGHTLEQRGLSLGDTAFYGRFTNPNPPFNNKSHDELYTIIVIGMHNGGITRQMGRNAVLLPFYALELIRGERLSYITFRFEVDTTCNREISAVKDKLQDIVRNRRQERFLGMDVHVYDEELRVVVGQMEQNLSLLKVLYPVVVTFLTAMGALLSFLLMLQNAKTAAIMRVLGATKMRTRMMLVLEQSIVTLAGIVLGLAMLPLLGVGFSAAITLFAILFLAVAIVSNIIGAIAVSNRAPLELLQVRE